jgi:hypothetical protein
VAGFCLISHGKRLIQAVAENGSSGEIAGGLTHAGKARLQ